MALLTTFYWQFTLPIPHTSFITQANTIAMHLIDKHLLRVLTVKKYCPHCQRHLMYQQCQPMTSILIAHIAV